MSDHLDNDRFGNWEETCSPESIVECTRFLAAHDRSAAAGTPLLTPAGIVWIEGIIAISQMDRVVPDWDRKLRQLWLGDQLLKEYRRPSPNQTAVLDAFEKLDWPRVVVDPLPKISGESELETKRRMHETIKSLNRGFSECAIQFHGDGSGHGISWNFFQEMCE